MSESHKLVYAAGCLGVQNDRVISCIFVMDGAREPLLNLVFLIESNFKLAMFVVMGLFI